VYTTKFNTQVFPALSWRAVFGNFLANLVIIY
jgi:hypothetical protein